jgi:hypothetical protein
MTQVPEYIERRIRQPIPAGLCVVPGTTPVVAFGDARKAKVATLGLNPSHREFLDSHGRELTGCSRRLASHRSLDVDNLENAPQKIIEQVFKESNMYFQRNPYDWFNQLESVLKACGASYCDGSACHVYLVQWATKTRWSPLDTKTKRRLLDADAHFLREQLSKENIELLLVNGNGVVKQLKKSLEARLEEASLDKLGPIPDFGQHTSHLYVGDVFNKLRIIAWNFNLQSSPGVSNELRGVLAERVGELAEMVRR